MSDLKLKLRGSCLCGELRYEISAIPRDCLLCHCSICRRLTGAMAGAYGTVAKQDFRWVSEPHTLATFAQNDRCDRAFCRRCGSAVFGTHQLDPDNLFLTLGCLEDTAEIRIEYQQFYASRASWSELSADTCVHDEWPAWVLEKARAARQSDDD